MNRCIHCGSTKKDHGRDLKRKTRLRNTFWHGWQDGECNCDWCTRGLYEALDQKLREKEGKP